MPALDTTARNTMATAASGIGSSLQIRQGTTVLATHTVPSFTTTAPGVRTAGAISDATAVESGTADNAILTGAGGVLTLTIGTSGAEVVVDSLSYVAGGNSVINSLVITYPAS